MVLIRKISFWATVDGEKLYNEIVLTTENWSVTSSNLQ